MVGPAQLLGVGLGGCWTGVVLSHMVGKCGSLWEVFTQAACPYQCVCLWTLSPDCVVGCVGSQVADGGWALAVCIG